MYKRIRTNKRLYELIGGTTVSKMGGTTHEIAFPLTLTFHKSTERLYRTFTIHFILWYFTLTIHKGTYSF